LKLKNPDLTEEEKQRFKELIGEFGDVFAPSNMELEGTDILKYHIHVKQDSKPATQKPYNYSEKARAEIEKQVQELLAIKFIRRSTSAWCSNVLLVKKHDKSMKMCVDYHKLNSCIIPEVHPVPIYTMIADTLSYPKPKIYSSFDLRTSFHNLKIKESSIKYTAFQTHIGQFEYLCCLFGIQNIGIQDFRDTGQDFRDTELSGYRRHPVSPVSPHVTHSF